MPAPELGATTRIDTFAVCVCAPSFGIVPLKSLPGVNGIVKPDTCDIISTEYPGGACTVSRYPVGPGPADEFWMMNTAEYVTPGTIRTLC
jgi:hypothetical protein